MRNPWLDEAQAGIKIVGRNINNFTYADDTTLMTESEEELESFLMKLKEESEKFGLNVSIKNKTKLRWRLLVHTVKSFGIVNETEVGGFQEFSCFLYD